MADNQATHLYVVFQGDYTVAPLAGEIWQTGLRFATRPGTTGPELVGPLVPFGVVAASTNIVETNWTITGNWTTEMGVSDLQPADWLNDQLAPAAATFFANVNFPITNRLKSILVYPIRTPDGKVQPAVPYSQGSPIRLDWTSAFVVGGGGTPLPLQTTPVFSLRTNNPGRRGRGRMFMPPLNTGAMANGRIATATVTSLAAAFKVFIEACRLDGSGPGGVYASPCVTGAPYVDAGLVTSLVLDDVLDTQQRRHRGLLPVKSTTTIDPIA